MPTMKTARSAPWSPRKVLTTLAVAAFAALLPAVGAAAAPAPSPAPPSADPSTATSVRPGEATANGRTVIGDGHVDMGARFVAGRWTIQVRDDSVRPAVWRNLTDVVLHAVDAAKVEVPGDQTFAFLGRPGSQVWVLPQVQQRGVLWPGWNTQDPQVATTVDREVTWKLNGVTGPGRFVLFVNGEFGAPRVLFNSARPYPQQTGIDVNTHVHGNWVFSAPGAYLLDIDMSARTLDDRQVTDRKLLRVFVGGGDATTAFTVAAPRGFPASPAEAADDAAPADRGGSTGGLPAWGWLLAGGIALIVVIAAVVRATTARAARHSNAAAPPPRGRGATGRDS